MKLDATVDDLLDYWRAREDTDVDVHFDGSGYRGEIRVGRHPMKDLTLEFGDVIATFECEGCGVVTRAGKRMSLPGTLAANASYVFYAQSQ